jgi:choline dehydrogenase-like flavoprotein
VSRAEAPGYDVVVVGGGTAGAGVASRLSEDPDRAVCLVEAGPSDVGMQRVLQLRNWHALLGSDLDFDYPTVPQPRGNSHIRHARARVLGGCSSHNTMICFLPLPADFAEWEAGGATGWGYDAMLPYFARLANHIQPVADEDRNPIAQDFVTAAAAVLSVPVVDDFNAKPFTEGVGFLPVGYDPQTGIRSSSSVAYLHPVLGRRPNLTVLTETWVGGLLVDRRGRATAVQVRYADGGTGVLWAHHQVVLCAGAIDTPRLLLLSGIGPADDLRTLGIDVVADVPGVGEHLLDHPESVIVWETGPLPPQSAMDSDAGLFVRRDPAAETPDLMFHFYQVPLTVNTERLGYPTPEHGVCMTPNIPKPRSAGRLQLRSADPAAKPALDFRYFTDPDGYDERAIVDGLRIAREVAASPPLRAWLTREVAPGPALTSVEDLSRYGRAAAHTVYHPVGTCRMGSPDDPLAVVDAELGLAGVEGVRIADASVFPTMPAVNPMVAVLMVGEKAAEIVAQAMAS